MKVLNDCSCLTVDPRCTDEAVNLLCMFNVGPQVY